MPAPRRRKTWLFIALPLAGAAVLFAGAAALRSPTAADGVALDRDRARRRPPRFIVPAAALTPTLPPEPAVPPAPLPAPHVDSKPAAQQFPGEDRDPVWAPRMEQYLTARIEAELPHLIPGFHPHPVECRRTMCRLTWDPPAAPANRPDKQGKPEKIDELNVMRLVGLLYGPAGGGVGGKNKREVVLRFDLASDPEATVRSMEKRRTERLAKLHGDRAAGWVPMAFRSLPLDALPVE